MNENVETDLVKAEAIDQWFENLQNYEATLVCSSSFDRDKQQVVEAMSV